MIASILKKIKNLLSKEITNTGQGIILALVFVLYALFAILHFLKIL